MMDLTVLGAPIPEPDPPPKSPADVPRPAANDDVPLWAVAV